MISGLLAVMRDVGQLPELPVLREMGTEVTAVLAGERCCRCCRILTSRERRSLPFPSARCDAGELCPFPSARCIRAGAAGATGGAPAVPGEAGGVATVTVVSVSFRMVRANAAEADLARAEEAGGACGTPSSRGGRRG